MSSPGLGQYIRVGCSGWNYRHWRGPFYPPDLPAKRWFAHYAAQFETVEINNSFYRLPTAETFEAWREEAPPSFHCAVKANRFITQEKKLKDCAEPIARMMAPTRHLGDALGPIVYQLPPMLGRDLARLETFLTLLPRDLIHVFEFRHSSWHVDETAALLSQHAPVWSRMIFLECHRRAGPLVRSLMSASTAAPANILVGTQATFWTPGPNG